MFKPDTCYIDISGVCNAHCPYCVKGSGAQKQGQFMSVENFKKLIGHLSKHGIFPASGKLNLYNWGEPFLHPQLNEILSITGDYGLRAHLSSNFVYLPNFTEKSLSVLSGMTFSLSGFSQESYGRIHGRSLDKVLRNFDTLLRWNDKAGCDWKPFVNWHRYRFNENEMGAAKEYFLKRRIAFTPTVAHLNDLQRTVDFFQNNISKKDISIIEKDLFINYLKDCMGKCVDTSWQCPQLSFLIINEKSEFLLCCGWADDVKGSVLGSVFDLPLKQLQTIRKNSSLCSACLRYGISKYMSNQFAFSLDNYIAKEKSMKVVKNTKNTIKGKIDFVKSKPLVSIGLVVHNAEKFLRKTLDSLLAQDYKNIEIIICDNASEDSSKDICLEFEARDKRIKYHRNIKNIGGAANFNQAFTLSSGEYFMWAADHDLWHSTYISKLLRGLLDDSSVSLCYGRTVLIDDQDNTIGMAPDVFDTRGMTLAEGFRKIIWEVSWGNMIYGLFRSNRLIATLPVPNTTGSDLVLLGRVSLLGAIAQINEPLFFRRKNRPDETPEEQIARQKRDLCLNNASLEAVAPWFMMSNAHLESVAKSHIIDAEKDYLAKEVIRSCLSRFGRSMEQEILAQVNSELNLLKKEPQNSKLDNINSCELVRLANIGRTFFPSLEGTDIIAGIGYLRMGMLDIAKQFAKKELNKFPSSTNAKLLLNHICYAEASNSGSINVMTWEKLSDLPLINLYAGDIPEKKEYDGLIGLSLARSAHRHIRHDINDPLPLPDNSVDSYQAEDMFEHIEYDRLLFIINEIYRVLKPDGTFRLSIPDYGCDVLIDRSVKDDSGNIVFDPDGGGTPQNPGHVWFPRIDKVKQLLAKSDFGKFGKVEYLHYYNMDGTFIADKIDYSKGHIQRTPDFDERVQNPYRPMSMVIDLIKDDKKLQEAIVLNERGEELFNKGDISGALTVFKKAIEIDPSFATAYNNLGELYWQNGEVQKAIDHIEKALKIDPNDQDAIVNSGNILTDLGKIEDARNLYSLYLQKNPEGEEVLLALKILERNITSNIGSVQGAYDKLWETKLNDHAWLKNDGKGRVEYCADFLKTHNRIGQGAKILDIGCGRGTLAHYLDPEVCLYGIDISEKAISEAGKVYKQADVVDLNSEKLPYEDNFFDLTITLDVIEHVFDPLFFLKEIHRVLKTGGEIILSTPNILNENLLKSLVHNRRFPKTSGDPFPYDGGHIHFFTYQDIFDLMKNVGFNFTSIGPLKDRFDYEFKESMAWVSGKKI